MNYSSVKNTAKNGMIIRADIRELVLALGFYLGFVHNEKRARRLYPHLEKEINIKRQKQYTEMSIFNLSDGSSIKDIENVPVWIVETIKYYFKYEQNGTNVYFYDTKKFRIYRNRLQFGQNKEWRLRKNTMQYFWTLSPLTIWYSLCAKKPQRCLSFRYFYCVQNAYNLEENMSAIAKYISEITKITDLEIRGTEIYFSKSSWKHLKKLINDEALRIKQRLYDGCYIELKEHQKQNIKEEYDYGKKSRDKIRLIVSRKKEKNSRTNRQD